MVGASLLEVVEMITASGEMMTSVVGGAVAVMTVLPVITLEYSRNYICKAFISLISSL